MRRLIYLFTIMLLLGCSPSNNNYNKVTIQPVDTVKLVNVEVHYTDTITLVVPNHVPDSIILKQVKQYTDSLRADSIRKDKVQSENFRKITKKINGGYNGQADRERLWERAKKELNNK